MHVNHNLRCADSNTRCELRQINNLTLHTLALHMRRVERLLDLVAAVLNVLERTLFIASHHARERRNQNHSRHTEMIEWTDANRPIASLIHRRVQSQLLAAHADHEGFDLLCHILPRVPSPMHVSHNAHARAQMRRTRRFSRASVDSSFPWWRRFCRWCDSAR